MWRNLWRRWLDQQSGSSRTAATRLRRARLRPQLEVLEDRLAPAVFAPLAATPDGAPGSLRADIIAANSNGQDNVINLQADFYKLTLENVAGQENAAATGDLDLTAT